MPKFMLSIFDDESMWTSLSPEESEQSMNEYYAFTDEARTAGALVQGEALQPSATATTIRGSAGGEALVTDGPFIEVKEQLGGFYLLECKDRDEAVAWARKIPSVRLGGNVEVREVQEYPQEG